MQLFYREINVLNVSFVLTTKEIGFNRSQIPEEFIYWERERDMAPKPLLITKLNTSLVTSN